MKEKKEKKMMQFEKYTEYAVEQAKRKKSGSGAEFFSVSIWFYWSIFSFFQKNGGGHFWKENIGTI